MQKHPLHSMSSYLGGFPPSVPRRIIDEWVPPGALVLDPFCGSGTTLLEALHLGNPCIGVDLNPLAVALARAKVQSVTLEDVLHRLDLLARDYPGVVDTETVPEALRIIYHPRTLAQLVFLRERLDGSAEDLFIRGALLGIMHGKFRKGGGTAYLSIDMPNTFSMSPEYVRKFVKAHQLRQTPVDTFSKLRERCIWLLREGSIGSAPYRQVVYGDATRLREVLGCVGIDSAGAMVTSPPYLGVLRYGAFNWIRLWFLGFDPYAIDRALDSTASMDRYLSFMTSFLLSLSEVLTPGSPAILVVGDVEDSSGRVRLAERIWDELEGVVPFHFLDIEEDLFDETSKTTRIWGEERKGRASPLDRILILERSAKSDVQKLKLVLTTPP